MGCFVVSFGMAVEGGSFLMAIITFDFLGILDGFSHPTQLKLLIQKDITAPKKA